jgi:hypothetical protein
MALLFAQATRQCRGKDGPQLADSPTPISRRTEVHRPLQIRRTAERMARSRSLTTTAAQQVRQFVQLVRGGGRRIGVVEVTLTGVVEVRDHVHIHSQTPTVADGRQRALGRGQGPDSARRRIAGEVQVRGSHR